MWIPRFACPECRTAAGAWAHSWVCPGCGHAIRESEGIYRCLTPSRTRDAQRFLEQYRHVRQREGRVRPAEYCVALPDVPRNDPHADEWSLRRASYLHLLEAGLLDEARRVLDLGAGNGWLSHRMVGNGHAAVAVDRDCDDADGLGLCRHYPRRFPAVQADFNALPFEPGQFDLVVLNGSLHYAPNPGATLAGAKRMLTPSGSIIVMDSPMFARDTDGQAMVERQLRRLAVEYGVPEPIRSGTGYLTFAALDRAASALGLKARFIRSRGPFVWRVRRQLAWIRLRRAPAAFGVWVAQ